MKSDDRLEELEKRVRNIEKRNERVETDKKWETSGLRRFSIVILTYSLVVLFFILNGFEKPFINAIVPTAGFFLSTLSLSLLKNYWLQRK